MKYNVIELFTYKDYYGKIKNNEIIDIEKFDNDDPIKLQYIDKLFKDGKEIYEWLKTKESENIIKRNEKIDFYISREYFNMFLDKIDKCYIHIDENEIFITKTKYGEYESIEYNSYEEFRDKVIEIYKKNNILTKK